MGDEPKNDTAKNITEKGNKEKSTNNETAIKRPRYKNTVHLWEFLLELLADERYSSMIAWSRKDYGEFKLKNQEEVARRWGIVKHRAGMNYEKLSRAIRYYYHQGIIQKVPGQRLVYKFGQLPYDYKPGRGKTIAKPAENVQRLQRPVPVPLDNIKNDSQAFLPLTSLTPPPEIGYQFPPSLLARNLSPMCGYCVDFGRMGTAIGTFPTSSVVFPNSCGYVYNSFNNVLPSPLRAIPVPVITSTPP